MRAGLHCGIVGLQCGVVPVCRQAGMGKKADKSFPSTTLRTSILRWLDENERFSGKETTCYIDRKSKFRIFCGSI
jgi:hypothetical protein